MRDTSPHALTESLDLLADTYNYNHWIYSLLRPYLGDCICEIGAGIGNLTRFFLPATRVICIEPEESYARELQRLAQVHRNIQVFPMRLAEYVSQRGDAPPEADSVVCVNVLEHMEDDAAALSLMARLLVDDGRLLLYVPACPWAFGALDEALGHYRRYSVRRVVSLAHAAGLKIVKRHYVNFIGAAGWFWFSRIRRARHIDPVKARRFDRWVPTVSAIERLLHPPVGQSLFIVMRRG